MNDALNYLSLLKFWSHCHLFRAKDVAERTEERLVNAKTHTFSQLFYTYIIGLKCLKLQFCE